MKVELKITKADARQDRSPTNRAGSKPREPSEEHYLELVHPRAGHSRHPQPLPPSPTRCDFPLKGSQKVAPCRTTATTQGSPAIITYEQTLLPKLGFDELPPDLEKRWFSVSTQRARLPQIACTTSVPLEPLRLGAQRNQDRIRAELSPHFQIPGKSLPRRSIPDTLLASTLGKRDLIELPPFTNSSCAPL